MRRQRARGFVVGVGLALIAGGCASAPTPGLTATSASGATATLAAPSTVPSPTATPTATPNTSQTAIDGFTSWLARPSKTIEAGVDGTDAGFIPMFGSIVVTSTGSYELLTAESGPIFAYERNSIANPSTRTLGAPYAPKPATLTIGERFGEALAASNGWTELGLEQRDGLTLHHLRAATSGLTDAGLFVDTFGGAATPPPGQLDAWVQADGQPVVLGYTGLDIALTFHIESDPSAPQLGHLFLDPWSRHASTKYGYAFDVPSSVSFGPLSAGEDAGGLKTYCLPKQGGTLAAWVAAGIRDASSHWGKPGSTIRTNGGVDPVGKSAIPMAITTYTDATSAPPNAITVASFATKTDFCDLLSYSAVQAASADEIHALVDRLLLTLTVTR